MARGLDDDLLARIPPDAGAVRTRNQREPELVRGARRIPNDQVMYSEASRAAPLEVSAGSSRPLTPPVKGSTTIVELLQRYPGEAARIMARLHWPCPHCGGAFHEPLTMAAKRHANDPRKVLEVFRSLEHGGQTDKQVKEAAKKIA